MDFLLLLAHHGLSACIVMIASIDQACSSVGFSPRPRRRAHVAPDPPPSALLLREARPPTHASPAS